ncbi:MAG: PVC-type heme-binding CxxCH protein [Verrucomicrobiota bacterium]
MSRPIFISALLSLPLLPLSAKELEGVYSAAQGPCPTVDEAIAKMTVPDGYAVRCFASEPMIINPVAMTWDSRGRLWVVELYEYPSGAKTPNDYSKTAADENFRSVIPTDAGSPRDRVIILEDTDNDGKADKRTVFLEGLSLATAILCGHDGVFVGQAPNLFFFRDTNGDDRADDYKTVLTGFGLEDRHELLNSFTWGPDGGMYFTHGVFTHSRVRRPGESEDKGNVLTAGIYRVRFSMEYDGDPKTQTLPRVASHEVYSDGTSNPWGVDFDARGNAFVEACVIDHFFHMAPGGIYARQGGTPENPYAYELLPSIVGKDHPRHFRAAYAGIQIYQGGVYPVDTHGHAFFGNIHDNAIHEEAMDPVGATFKARPVRDFLRANNGWFRPVSVQTGPDGFLWIMDWCDKYPCYQNAQANPEGVDREKGRIWRVCYTGSEEGKKLAEVSRKDKDLNLRNLTRTERARLVGDSNNWVSRQAAVTYAQLDGADDKLNSPSKLFEQASKATETAKRLAALDAISMISPHFGNTPPEEAVSALAGLAKDPDAGIRGRAINVASQAGRDLTAAGRPSEAVEKTLHQLLRDTASDKDPWVRLQVATALRQWVSSKLTVNSPETMLRETEPAQIAPILSVLMEHSSKAEDKTLPFLIWEAFEPKLAYWPAKYLPFLADLAPKTKPLSLTLTYKSARRITDTRRAENMDLLLAFLDKIRDDDELTARALDGMLKAQEAGALKPAKTDPAPLFALWRESRSEKVRSLAGRLATLWGDPNAIAALMGTALDPQADTAQRMEAIKTVRRLKSDAARAGILKLLGTRTPDSLTLETIRAAGELGGIDLANEILAAWQSYSPALKTTAAEVFATRADWATRLLDAVEGKWIASGKISPDGIPVSVRRSFALNKDLKERAAQLLGTWNESGDDVKALIAAKRKACLEGEPDLALGKVLFTATCATCHVFHGGGQLVGPDLIGSGRSNLDAILANLIDPNQIIGNGYQNFIITTKDGRTLAGRIVENTPTQITLLGIGGSREVVPVADIEKKEDTGLSLMPMGFGSLPDDQFRSLIWYILAPPEEGPLTPEKKDALIRGAEGEAQALSKPAKTKTAAANAAEDPHPPIDRESVSLWNPDWKVTAPDFEGTPRKLTDYAGRKNVLMLHPFPDRKTPSALTRRLSVPAAGKAVLSFDVASGEGVDWELVITIDGREAGKRLIGSGEPRWKNQTVDLTPWAGKEVDISLENHANNWSWEFSYWSGLKVTVSP